MILAISFPYCFGFRSSQPSLGSLTIHLAFLNVCRIKDQAKYIESDHDLWLTSNFKLGIGLKTEWVYSILSLTFSKLWTDENNTQGNTSIVYILIFVLPVLLYTLNVSVWPLQKAEKKISQKVTSIFCLILLDYFKWKMFWLNP